MLETRQLLALTVLNANDSGPGSLRQAILDANSLATSQATIVFSLPAGPQTINLLSPLPPSTHAIVAQLDATQNVTVVSPATGAQDNLPALTETGGGTLTFDGTNNPTGNIQVDSGSLQLNAGDPPATAPQPFALAPLGFEVINLGRDRPVRLDFVIQSIASQFDRQPVIEYRPAHPADVPATWANVEKARRLLDWSPQVGVEEGLQRTADWYRANRDEVLSVAIDE